MQQLKSWKQKLAALSDEKERIERELARQSQEFRKAQLPVTPARLAKMLPEDVALIDFLEYWHTTTAPVGTTGGSHYEHRLVAFIVRRSPRVTRVDFGPVQPIMKAVLTWRRLIMRHRGGASRGLALVTRPDQEKGARPQDEVRSLVWQPLEKHLEGIKTVLISPDGVTAGLPFACLPGRRKGNYLIEERAIAVVPVPRQIPDLFDLQRDPKPKVKPSFLAVGGVDFGGSPGAFGLAQNRAAVPPPRTAARGAGMTFQALPGTEQEILSIGRLFRKHFPAAAIKGLRGSSATEGAIREAAPKYRYVHIATHGFFAPHESRDDSSRQGAAPSVAEVHPGLLSGLAVAGANRGAVGPNSDDGILTTLEVSALNLNHVDLVVLSACETGLGKVAAGGEGVLGLQRAFQIAGARTTVTSLWKVDDVATQILMTEFYRNLWENNLPRGEALRQAQLTMLNHYDPKLRKLRPRGLKRGNAEKVTTESRRLPPFYWGAFALSGDWR